MRWRSIDSAARTEAAARYEFGIALDQDLG